MASVGTLRYVYIRDVSFFVLRVVGSQVWNRTTGILLDSHYYSFYNNETRGNPFSFMVS